MTLERNSLVWGIVGNLGGGKTLSAVQMGVSSMLQGYYVVSNVTFDIDTICRIYNHSWLRGLYQHVDLDSPEFDPFKLPCGDPRGSGGKKRVLIILDEVAEWFDQYSSAKDPRINRLWSWLRHSSKRSQDVIIICQRREYINKVVRNLIARWVWVDDLAVYRVPKLRFKLPFCSGLVVQNFFDRLGNRIGAPVFLRKSFWGRFYNTAECLNSTGSSYNSIYQLPDEKYNISKTTLILYFTSFLYIIYLMAQTRASAAAATWY